MSEEFLRVARQEIQAELDSLRDIFLSCTSDQHVYERSSDIERHMHKIKGLAPMMDQNKVGEIAQISDAIVKHIAKHGALAGSQSMIANAVRLMHQLFSGQTDTGTEDFLTQAKESYRALQD